MRYTVYIHLSQRQCSGVVRARGRGSHQRLGSLPAHHTMSRCVRDMHGHIHTYILHHFGVTLIDGAVCGMRYGLAPSLAAKEAR